MEGFYGQADRGVPSIRCSRDPQKSDVAPQAFVDRKEYGRGRTMTGFLLRYCPSLRWFLRCLLFRNGSFCRCLYFHFLRQGSPQHNSFLRQSLFQTIQPTQPVVGVFSGFKVAAHFLIYPVKCFLSVLSAAVFGWLTGSPSDCNIPPDPYF